MSPPSTLARAAERARAWLFEDALPLWAERGVDPRDGSFYERLTATGEPDVEAPRRMRVQARQLHVFCEAAVLGWGGDARAIASRALEPFLDNCWAPDGRPGWVHTLDRDGRVLDPQRDTYDHAFALFALAWAHKALGDPRARAYADRTLAYLDAELADRVHGGYAEGSGPAPLRRSNPHMHLLEAFLAWHAATGEAVWLDRANGIVRLFRTRFFDGATGTLGEHFQEDWTLAPGPEGQVVEPGHHFEWAWLLHWAANAGAERALGEARRLYDFALSHGLDRSGFVVDELDRSGRITRASRRSWPQTERVKAHIAMARAGDPTAAQAAAAAAEALLDSPYLAIPLRGAWVDQFGPDGAPMGVQAPASTFYHLMVCFRELIKLAER